MKRKSVKNGGEKGGDEGGEEERKMKGIGDKEFKLDTKVTLI